MIPNDLGQTGVTLLAGLVAVVLFMGTGLVLARRQRKLTVVDTMWPLGFVVVALVSSLVAGQGQGDADQRWYLFAMVLVWGGRLAWYLHGRNSKAPEDPRYQALAEKDGRSFAQVALTRVFLPQGIAMYLVALPLMVGSNNERISTPLAWLGFAVWLLGFVFESVGDAQLKRFKADPENKGKLMDQGLWRYTRHPNYFGDACVWAGLWISVAASLPGLLTVISPIAMTVFLTKVTGASLNEKGMKQSKPGYDDYVRRTSGFVPWFPKE